ncbi:EEF1A lysine methyltransferase 4-like [Zingiber officinale]|uniref:EEF1A lysine methyltransferase 4-like n=1 Tax=Zingiber officinale TaxID=94328 RepID=UPI001C4DC475|nr:EEF1A lysine methyltransferase 4-like [Zingiber officinale]
MGDSGDHGRGSSPVDVAPLNASSYLDPHYWDERFAAEEHYEWLKDYSHFQHLLRPFLNPSHSVLEIGCGNSRLCEELRKDDVADMTCVDISPVAVERMRSRFRDKGLEGIKVVQADMLDLPFGSESFDIVIEKGTMDVLFVNSGDPWNPHPETINKVMKMLEDVHSVLKPEGIFISISFGQPHFRRPLFEGASFTWSVEWKTFGEGFHYFFYILKKGRRILKSDDCKNERSDVPSISLLHEELEDEDYMFRTTLCDELEN